MKNALARTFLNIPFLADVWTRRQFRLERAVLQGRHQTTSGHPSILHFSVNRAATQYVRRILCRCASANGLVPINLNDYAFHTEMPYLDHLAEADMIAYKQAFYSCGYLYSVFGGMVEGIPSFEDYHVILVVRDPRDVLTSRYYSTAYSHPPPGSAGKRKAFLQHRNRVRQESVDQYVIREAERTRQIYQRYAVHLAGRRNVHITTYESMIADFPAWLDKILVFCDLEIEQEVRQWLIAEAANSQPKCENKYDHLRQRTPGDYTRKLQPDTITRLDSDLREVLLEFGYA